MSEKGKTEKVAKLKDRLREALTLREKKAVDLSRDLDISQSALSQYLNGSSKRIPTDRFEAICEYLDVSEPWMLGYDVPMERITQEKNDIMADVVLRMRTDLDYYIIAASALKLNRSQLVTVRNLLTTFLQDPQDQI